MRRYQIAFEFDLTDEENTLLQKIIGVDNDNDLLDYLSNMSKSSLEEYTRMFFGQKVFTRGSDIKEYRLFLLIKEVFNNKIPDEDTVSKYFQLTPSESKSLIRSVMSKYQYELNDAIDNSCIDVLNNAQEVFLDENDEDTLEHFVVDIKNENILRELNRILGHNEDTLPMIKKVSNTYSTYIIKPSSFEALQTFFNLPLQEVQ